MHAFSHNNWTQTEWTRFAMALMEQHPEVDYLAITRSEDVPATSDDLRAAQDAAILPARRSSVIHVPLYKQHLLRCFDALRNNPGLAGRIAQPAGRAPTLIRWSGGEWRTLALALAQQFPTIDFLAPGALDQVPGDTLLALMRSALPAHRQRQTVRSQELLPKLAQAFMLARQQGDLALFPGGIQSDKNRPLPRVFRPESRLGMPLNSKVYWRDDEWDRIARQLLEDRPDALDSIDLLTPDDIHRAQRVLIPTRQRLLKGMDIVRARMLESLPKVVMEKQAAAERAQREREAQALPPAAQQELALQPTAVEQLVAERTEPFAEAVGELREEVDNLASLAKFHIQRLQATQQEPSTADPRWEAAFKPLTNLLATEFAGALFPIVRELVLGALTGSHMREWMIEAVQAALQAPVSVPAAPPDAAPAAVEDPPAKKPDAAAHPSHRPLIALIGNRSKYENEMAMAFPQLRFLCLTKRHELTRARKCAFTLAMIGFVGHDMTDKAKQVAGERYLAVPGGLSGVKRQIEDLIAHGKLPAGPDAPATPAWPVTPDAVSETA